MSDLPLVYESIVPEGGGWTDDAVGGVPVAHETARVCKCGTELLAVHSLHVGGWGGGAIHAADPATAEPDSDHHEIYYRSRCGMRYMTRYSNRLYDEVMMPERCGRCERIVNGKSNPHKMGR